MSWKNATDNFGSFLHGNQNMGSMVINDNVLATLRLRVCWFSMLTLEGEILDSNVHRDFRLSNDILLGIRIYLVDPFYMDYRMCSKFYFFLFFLF